MKKIIILFLSCLSLLAQAQKSACPTVLSQEQLQQLKAFQQKLEIGQVSFAKKGVQYVPMRAHIVGNAQGQGYYSVTNLLRAMCDINEDYIPTGFRFYLIDSIDYINDDGLYQGNSDAIWTYAENYKTEGAVNVFFHGSGAQWCGVYFPGVDVVFIRTYCQVANSTTLTHELGHFFSLPHTFSGWENNTTPSNIEKLNGSNCRSAGDGFCDTKADYVSERWNCPLGYNLTDPTGAKFKPDSSIYMTYSLDACQSRFSNEQMAAMNNNLSSRRIAVSSMDVRSLTPPQKIFPLENDSNINALEVHLKWKSVPGAFAYHLQIARFGDWNYLNYDKLIFDTTAIAELYGKWDYAWRIKAITAANTCSQFGTVDTFSTIELPTGFAQISWQEDLVVYPNPVQAKHAIQMVLPTNGELELVNNLGEIIYEINSTDHPESSFTLSHPGIYFLRFNKNNKQFVKKIICVD